MIILDYQDRRPIYEQVVEKIQLLIVRGVLAPDSQLPSVRKLAMELSINPNTIQRAYAELEQQGFIYPVKGRGNFVSPNVELIQRQKELYYRDLKKIVRLCKKLGISKEELLEQVAAYYEEEGRYFIYLMIAIFRQSPRPQRWKSFIADITRLLTPQDFIKCSRSLI